MTVMNTVKGYIVAGIIVGKKIVKETIIGIKTIVLAVRVQVKICKKIGELQKRNK